MNFREIIEEYNRKVKENPRYAIDILADKDGNVKLFFEPKDFKSYKDGEMVIASTERFYPNDIVHSVPKDRIDRLSDGNTLAHIKAV